MDCRTDEHPWNKPQSETFALRTGGWVQLHRYSCTCTICRMRCTAREVRVADWDEDPTMEITLADDAAAAAPELPKRRPKHHLWDELRAATPPAHVPHWTQTTPDGATWGAATPENLERLIGGLERLGDGDEGEG